MADGGWRMARWRQTAVGVLLAGVNGEASACVR